MKKIKIPSILAFAGAIVRVLFLSMVMGFVLNLGNMDLASVAFDTKVAFFVILGLQLLLGVLRIRVAPKGAFRDDSLVVNDTTYAGTFAPYFILPALFGMDTYNKGLVYFKDGIKKKHTIGKLDFTRPLQPRVATPTQSGGNITIDGNVIEPKDVMVYQEFNPRDLESHWTAEDLSSTLLTRQLPATVENYISMLIVSRAFEQYENGIWMGSANYANNVNVPDTDSRYQLQFFDGFMKKFIADSGVYKTAGAVALTAGNIADQLLDLYTEAAQSNKALLTNPAKYSRMKFMVSIETALLYEDFLTTQPYKNNDTTEKGIMKYKGFEIVPLAGMPNNTIVFTEAMTSVEGNLWLGMNSILDENFQLARLQANSEIFFYKMLMKMDVQYGFANKLFVYTTLTSNDFTA